MMKIHTADLLSCAGTKLVPAQHREPTGIFVEIISTNQSKSLSKIYSLKNARQKIVSAIYTRKQFKTTIYHWVHQ